MEEITAEEVKSTIRSYLKIPYIIQCLEVEKANVSDIYISQRSLIGIAMTGEYDEFQHSIAVEKAGLEIYANTIGLEKRIIRLRRKYDTFIERCPVETGLLKRLIRRKSITETELMTYEYVKSVESELEYYYSSQAKSKEVREQQQMILRLKLRQEKKGIKINERD